MMPLALSSRSRPMPGSWSLPKPLAFAFSCAPPPKGTTCKLNRLLRHGSPGRPYIACDGKVSRRKDVALLLQDVSVLMHDCEPTPRHFLRRMAYNAMLSGVSRSSVRAPAHFRHVVDTALLLGQFRPNGRRGCAAPCAVTLSLSLRRPRGHMWARVGS